MTKSSNHSWSQIHEWIFLIFFFLLYQFLLYFLQLKSFPPWMACFNSNINDSEVVLLTKFDGRTYFVKSQSSLLNFCHLTSFLFHHHHFNGNFGKTVFSVKSSREVHWIIMFQKDSMRPQAPGTAGAVGTQTGQFISNFRWLVSSFFGTCFESLRICRSNPLFHGSRTEKKLDHEKTTDKPILGWKSMVLIVLCIWFWSFD